MIQGGCPDKSVFIRALGRKRTSRDDHNPGAMAMERKIFDLKGHAPFVDLLLLRGLIETPLVAGENDN